jgi:GNAT superfamily N-acetyltransferase
MRIRNFRQGDIARLVQIQQLAAEVDGAEAMRAADFGQWLMQPELEAEFNVFVITDDDDELNAWGQAGTLEGLEGETVGYTVLQFRRSQHSYHFLCQGAVHPLYRRQNAGFALLICALNRVHMLTSEFEFEAELAGHPIYFEALLPVRDAASERLARKCEMQPADERVLEGMKLYRRAL